MGSYQVRTHLVIMYRFTQPVYNEIKVYSIPLKSLEMEPYDQFQLSS